MRIPKYWARGSAEGVDDQGKPVSISCWGWSDLGEGDARQKGVDRAGRILARFVSGERLDRYEYGHLPLHEEVIETIGPAQKPIGVITRNSYGALVLNASQAMFVDMDFPEAPAFSGLGKSIKKLFGKKDPSPEEAAIREARAWVGRHPDLSVRCYRTHSGLRCLVTSETFDPRSDDTIRLMTELHCDPLYVRLCKNQECFRARLTPKPWRINMQRPSAPQSRDPRDYRNFRQWQDQYNASAPKFTVCRLVAEIGSGLVRREIEPIVAIHDRHCLQGDGLPLA